ncbi:hypothetical protein [Brevibacillus reuszeri]|uniref:hypothetical protein n=1 Tax=Brevibacillus reuszeri TaxID=54915 RepID=UPI0013DF8ACB|nr:hypothetical protein [Brevibacillus reuszeri]
MTNEQAAAQKIQRGDKVEVKSTGYQGVVADIQYVHNRYQLTDVSGWQYGIDNIQRLTK